ncbi:hypothetical protein EJ076_34780 [Mesorhizobium sp. M7D.F.Ca.US.005.01.1.1]|uniref:hypothetical protein n=1 Tax=Mesorhizobium sp. M7D.F.Ca.US.005.01.1.1 TaxID=2493678 RepID=UPI000F75B93D|nr:hypothetical protein [Mesorhizobium sp. M7D.F.Ca.US.005.01.1.1]AZO45884.1 hypothetical protein EJ076_34780 [Mesorhizobium sp. M7D.F.Ca.US.005.01.1.1]
MTLVAFTPWAPDTADLNTQDTGDILNVLPSVDSYLPFPDLAPFTTALAAKPLGYFTARSLSGSITIFAGTATKLYRLDNTTLSWTDISKPATTYGATDVARWSFEQFGEYVVAVNLNDDPQVFQLGVSTNFDTLAGSPPRAAFVRAWGDFLVLQQLATSPNRVHWSSLNDITGWTPGTNNSDFQDFPEGGAVQGSSRATNPIIILERTIYLGTFVPGSSIIFSFIKIHDGRGAKSPYSIASRGENTFFADEGGFFQIGADGSISGVGFEKVDRTYFGQIAASNLATMVGAIDPFYSRVYWTFDLTGTGSNNFILIYDWLQTRWTIAAQDNVGIFPAATAGYTLEGLDSVSTDIDLLPYSLDSKVWQGGAPLLAAWTTDYRLGFFNGTPKQATLTTQEQGDVAGTITMLSSFYGVVDTDNYTVAIGSRMKRGGASTWTPELSPHSISGRVTKMLAARFLKIRMTIPAGVLWTHAQGIEVPSKPAGRQ